MNLNHQNKQILRKQSLATPNYNIYAWGPAGIFLLNQDEEYLNFMYEACAAIPNGDTDMRPIFYPFGMHRIIIVKSIL